MKSEDEEINLKEYSLLNFINLNKEIFVKSSYKKEFLCLLKEITFLCKMLSYKISYKNSYRFVSIEFSKKEIKILIDFFLSRKNTIYSADLFLEGIIEKDISSFFDEVGILTLRKNQWYHFKNQKEINYLFISLIKIVNSLEKVK